MVKRMNMSWNSVFRCLTIVYYYRYIIYTYILHMILHICIIYIYICEHVLYLHIMLRVLHGDYHTKTTARNMLANPTAHPSTSPSPSEHAARGRWPRIAGSDKGLLIAIVSQ